jgi:hypothetical protein
VSHLLQALMGLALLILASITAVGSPPPTPDGERSGWATWYDDGPGLYGAAGPAIRVGSWRGRLVEVCAEQCVTVRLTDWCACGQRHGRPTLIDLSPAAFRQLAPLSAGVVSVRVEWRGAAGPIVTLPPTDTAP